MGATERQGSPGLGRPEIGPAFSVRLGEELTGRLDAAAKAAGLTRAAMLRRIVTDHLGNDHGEPMRPA